MLTSAAFVTSFKAPSMSFESISSSKMRACDARDLHFARHSSHAAMCAMPTCTNVRSSSRGSELIIERVVMWSHALLLFGCAGRVSHGVVAVKLRKPMVDVLGMEHMVPATATASCEGTRPSHSKPNVKQTVQRAASATPQAEKDCTGLLAHHKVGLQGKAWSNIIQRT